MWRCDCSTIYFSFDDRIDRAPAYVDKATAHLALGQTDQAIAAYEAALAVEASFPQVRTSAGSDLAMLIAVNRLADRYDQALEVSVWPPGQLELPALRFAYHAPRALIFADRGLKEDARQEAEAALAAADRQHSGLSRHPTVGLVANDERALKERLMQIADPRAGSVMSRIRQKLFG